MKRIIARRIIGAVCTCCALAGPEALPQQARAQQAIAPVEGNRSDFRDWQPSQGEVDAREKAAGVAVPAQQQRATDQSLDQLDQELMNKNGQLSGEIRRLDGPNAPGAQK